MYFYLGRFPSGRAIRYIFFVQYTMYKLAM